MNITIDVQMRGVLATSSYDRINSLVEKQIAHEILGKVAERTKRQGRGLGAQRNTIDQDERRMELEVTSTKNYPRTKGTAWRRKNINIVKSMAPHVARKAAQRIAADLQ